MNDAHHYRAQAVKCRALAKESDERTAANLLMLAEEYEAEALRQEARPPMPGPEQT